MNVRFVPGCFCWLVAISDPISAQNPTLAEKIRDVLDKTYDAVLAKLPDAGSKPRLKESSEHRLRAETPRQRSRLIKRVAVRWLTQSATQP